MNVAMKTKLLSLLAIFCLSESTLQAQSFSVGGGAEYNLSIEEIGYHLRAYYNIGEHLCFGPEFTVFGNSVTTEAGEEITESSLEYNLNGHYIFELSHKIGTYPVLGLNHTRISESYTDLVSGVTGEKDISTWAANVGWGAHLNLSKAAIFFEYHTNISKPGDHILSFGALFHLGDPGEGEDKHSIQH